MTGREIVNLTYILKKKGMSSDEIIEIIRFIELTDPQTQLLNDDDEAKDGGAESKAK